MKNNFIKAAALLLPSIFFAQNAVKVAADIRGRDCNGGSGLCSFEQSIGKNNSATNVVLKKISDKTIAMIIDRESLSKETQISITGKSFSEISEKEHSEFTQEKDISLDDGVLRNLEIDPKYNLIKEGKYPILLEEEKVVVILPLTSQ